LCAAHVGHLPIRTRGTLGGSLAHADPAAELPVAAVALDARLRLRSRRAERTLEASSAFLGPFTTAFAPDEALVSVEIPPAAGTRRCGFAELAVRPGDFALVAAAVVATVDEGTLADARVVLGGVEGTPLRATAAEAALEGAEAAPAAFAEAAAAAATGCDPPDDALVGAAYRRRLVERLVRDALESLS
jgi:CO/xanthine dehydrogenase FAD-binding subunit